MEARQGNELELVSHAGQFGLEDGDRLVVELLLPVERGRAVIGQHLAGELGVDAFGEFASFFQIWLRRLAPEHFDIGRIGQAARDGSLKPAANTEEAFRGAFSG